LVCIALEEGAARRDRFERLKTLAVTMSMVLVLAHVFMVLTWPYLGANFFRHYLEILKVISNFPFLGLVEFMGKKIPANALPWYYIPVWLWISTPLVVLLPALISPWSLYSQKGRRLWILLSLAVLGILALWIFVRPVIYGDYRHFLFVTPPLSVLGGWAIFQKARKTGAFWVLFALVIVGAGVSMADIVRLHPYEYIYMNEFVGGIQGSDGRYPTDDVGTGFKECAEWLTKNLPPFPGKTWKVNTLAQPFQSLYYFPKYIKWSEFDEADIFVAFSHCVGFYDVQNKFHSLQGWVPIHVVERRGVPLFYIYKRSPKPAS
jgi:hypothetical protein